MNVFFNFLILVFKFNIKSSNDTRIYTDFCSLVLLM